jgi:hypothetical protein
MKLTRAIFWDTNYDTIDWEAHARYVIARVCRFGMLEDWKQIKAYYGLERIKEEMLQERDLDPKTLHFLACIFDVPIEEFRCYKLQQSLPKLWVY